MSIKPTNSRTNPRQLAGKWRGAWPRALAAWSALTKLRRPTLCETRVQAREEGLTGSFAMIRLVDHTIVIDLREIIRYRLEEFATEILAHEIGHHVFVPANLADNARLQVIIRRGLPTFEQYAGFIANLYADLLLNDRLQRDAGLDMAGVYRKIVARDGKPTDPLSQLYFRSYEVLWQLEPGALVEPKVANYINADALLVARLVRAYTKNWLAGAGRFATLCLDYLLEMGQKTELERVVSGSWLDTIRAGRGEQIPDGMAGLAAGEEGGFIHPRDDPELNGLLPQGEGQVGTKSRARQQEEGGQKARYRSPADYTDFMEELGVEVDPRELINQYYRELARPHVVRFPSRRRPQAQDPVIEGVEPWELGAPVSRIDWLESLIRSPQVVPGVTTVERSYGRARAGEPESRPVDLYLGVDCSGSMVDPARLCSYPVVAGGVMLLSALRAGAKVMTVLSGEPGEYAQTDGFSRDEREHMGVLTSYLGTGYSFGISRLKSAFLERPAPKKPCHIVVITDMDIFYMLDEVEDGWEIARRAIERAGGGASCVLDIHESWADDERISKLEEIGWEPYIVHDEESLVSFARDFSRRHFQDFRARARAKQKRPGAKP